MTWNPKAVYQHPDDYEAKIKELEAQIKALEARLAKAVTCFRAYAPWLKERGYDAAAVMAFSRARHRGRPPGP